MTPSNCLFQKKFVSKRWLIYSKLSRYWHGVLVYRWHCCAFQKGSNPVGVVLLNGCIRFIAPVKSVYPLNKKNIYSKLKLLLLLLYDPSAKREYQLVGHVSYEEDSRITSSINPLPCGLGLMNIAMLLSTTLQSTKRAYGFN